jgi:hypothetical protein
MREMLLEKDFRLSGRSVKQLSTSGKIVLRIFAGFSEDFGKESNFWTG